MVVVGGAAVVDGGETAGATVVSVADGSPPLVGVGATVVDVVAVVVVGAAAAVVAGATWGPVGLGAVKLVVAVRTGEGASVTCPRTLPTAADAINTEIAVTATQAAMSPALLFTRSSCPSKWV